MPLSKQDAEAIVQLGRDLGVHPASIGGLMELESNIDPNVWGGSGGQYKGLIQFGPAARQEVGLPNRQMTVAEQIPYVRKYFQQRGYTPGKHGVTEMYRTVLVGNPYQSGTDTFGTQSDKAAQRMMPGGDLYQRAQQKLGAALGSPVQNAASTQATTGKPSTTALGRVLLDSFLKLFTGGSSQSAVPRSGLPAPELPSYDEDESEGPSELNLLLNAYKGQQAQEDLEQSFKEVASKQMGSYAAAADAAKARLLAEAMNAFGTPSSVL